MIQSIIPKTEIAKTRPTICQMQPYMAQQICFRWSLPSFKIIFLKLKSRNQVQVKMYSFQAYIRPNYYKYSFYST